MCRTGACMQNESVKVREGCRKITPRKLLSISAADNGQVAKNANYTCTKKPRLSDSVQEHRILEVVEIRSILVLLHNTCANAIVAKPLILLPVGGIVGKQRGQRTDNSSLVHALLVNAIRTVA